MVLWYAHDLMQGSADREVNLTEAQRIEAYPGGLVRLVYVLCGCADLIQVVDFPKRTFCYDTQSSCSSHNGLICGSIYRPDRFTA